MKIFVTVIRRVYIVGIPFIAIDNISLYSMMSKASSFERNGKATVYFCLDLYATDVQKMMAEKELKEDQNLRGVIINWEMSDVPV